MEEWIVTFDLEQPFTCDPTNSGVFVLNLDDQIAQLISNFTVVLYTSGSCGPEPNEITCNITVVGPDTDKAAPYVNSALQNNSPELSALSYDMGTTVTIASISQPNDGGGLSGGAIAGIVIGCIIAAILIIVALMFLFKHFAAGDDKFEKV